MNTLEVLACATLVTWSMLSRTAPPQDWSSSPEASFLTAEEKKEWKGLASEDARDDFRKLYWMRRDPNPATETNEFRSIVEARIRSADAQLTIGKIPGSRTARGLALIVFGRPSVQREIVGPIKNAPELIDPNRISIPNEAFSSTQFQTWVYDRDTRSDLLDVLQVPIVELSFIVEPGHRDELQQPMKFQQWKDIIARHSIVNLAPRQSLTSFGREPRERIDQQLPPSR
jgi:GWxTD domain-containing protein